MEFPNSDETLPENPEGSQESQPSNSIVENEDHDDGAAADGGDSSAVVGDISGQSLDFPIPENSDHTEEALYLYKNEFNLLPKSISRGAKRLKTLKFFANEINLFPPSSVAAEEEEEEFGSMESLQVRMSSPEFGELPLNKGLKEVSLWKLPPRPSGLKILKEVSGLKSLTKLSLCHLSIRYLPPEIGRLDSLEHLDLSFNKMKSLATEISNLNALISLKVSNNRLVELPWNLSLLQCLELMDLSYNQLASLGSLEVELDLMKNLETLDLQYNKLLNECQIPSWVCCNLEGNNVKDTGGVYHDVSSSSDEMEFCESVIIDRKDADEVSSRRRGRIRHRSVSGGCGDRRLGRWRRNKRKTLQQRARQECFNKDLVASESSSESVSEVINPDDDNDGDKDVVRCKRSVEEKELLHSSTADKSNEKDEEVSSAEQDQGSSAEVSKSSSRSKRHFDEDLDDLREPKHLKNRADSLNLSRKYSDVSWCSSEDHLGDGFYDAGRDRPFMPLEFYEQKIHLDSREVLLVDREWDQELDAILRAAQEAVHRLRTDGNQADELQIASLLALLVSDHFGGSDRTAFGERTRKVNPFSDYRKPFVCTCPTGNRELSNLSTKPVVKTVGDIGLADICEKSLNAIKAQRNSIVVPIGTLQFGVCRHRALLLKYLCDSLEPRIPCELVRGYIDFMPHAWNVVLIKGGDSEIRRMVVDACRPLDIGEETNPEYYYRYISLNHTRVPLPFESSISSCGKNLTDSGTALIRTKYGTNNAAGKMRSLKVYGNSKEEIRSFDYNCLGEIRILRALQHPCIVELYGHQISSKWIPSVDGSPEHRILQSVIWMEDIKGGSLRSYIDKLSEAGEKQVPVELAMCIAKDVACALMEVHSKHIIHRDIKSANVLVDLDTETPVVKLCDFDSAVPLRSYLHTCCVAHVGIPPPDVCVGTPRWMAPEVLRATHEPNIYGLEIDIWSFGCLLLELLTLKVPYLEVPQPKIHQHLAIGKRPKLTHELEALRLLDEPAMRKEAHTQRFLVDLFYQCTEESPKNRPTADELYELLLHHSNALPN